LLICSEKGIKNLGTWAAPLGSAEEFADHRSV